MWNQILREAEMLEKGGNWGIIEKELTKLLPILKFQLNTLFFPFPSNPSSYILYFKVLRNAAIGRALPSACRARIKYEFKKCFYRTETFPRTPF